MTVREHACKGPRPLRRSSCVLDDRAIHRIGYLDAHMGKEEHRDPCVDVCGKPYRNAPDEETGSGDVRDTGDDEAAEVLKQIQRASENQAQK